MAAGLGSLGDDDVDAGRRRSLCVWYGPDLMEDLHTCCVGRPHVRRRITPEQREDGDALLQTHGDEVLDREVQEQVHTERLIGQRSNAMDLLTEERWRIELRLQYTEATRVAHRRDHLRASQVRAHRRADDRIFDTQRVAERGFHRRFGRIPGDEAETGGSRRVNYGSLHESSPINRSIVEAYAPAARALFLGFVPFSLTTPRW